MALYNLLRKTESLCPRCLEKIPAELVEEEGKVLIKKECPEHGRFSDIYWSDVENYKKTIECWNNGTGVENPRTKRNRGCPYDCGLCEEHMSQTVLGIVDVTNRCNLKCPICFANSDSTKRVYEPTREEIRAMLQNLRDNRPIPSFALQFSGGEPTMRDDLPELIKIAKDVGFTYVMVDTNGIRVARDVKYLEKLKDAGMNSFYLQFDGLDDEIYEKTRGERLLNTKLKVIENCRKLGYRCVVLVATLIKGVNDHQVGGIIEFAIRNSDVISCVNFQPISFSGKASQIEVKDGRITTSEFVKLVEKQTKGKLIEEHFYPVPSLVPISRFIGAYKKKPAIQLSTHPCCGVGAYLIIYEDQEAFPINDVINVGRLLEVLDTGAKRLEGEKRLISNLKDLKTATEVLGDVVHAIVDKKLRKLMIDILKKGTIHSVMNLHQNTLMIGCMHFMDPWNFDIERVERCVIHYATPDGRIIPFCSYNNIHRQEVERKHSTPLEEWKKKKLQELLS
ncbi:MAG: radical SAM protein [Candidatus Altiarchaeota archaeon]|nr:radical SAM protein [Candidatus Altiarchaeota archaeon]